MSEHVQILADTATRIFQDFTSNDPGESALNSALWSVLEENGLTQLSSFDEEGQVRDNVRDAVALLMIAGRFVLHLPLSETILASSAMAAVGRDVPAGPLTLCFAADGALQRSGDDWDLSGSIARVPWASHARWLVVLGRYGVDEYLTIVDSADCRITSGFNLAGEARDDIEFDMKAGSRDVVALPRGSIRQLHLKDALYHAAMILGASERACELALLYTADRRQFGKPIGSFQVIQHEAARMAGEVIALRIACESAALQFDSPSLDTTASFVAVVSAKVQGERTASIVARGAHQLHGAMGVTAEYPLHLSTTRLWSWRDEVGSAAQWRNEIGDLVVNGERSVWEVLTLGDSG